MTGTSVLISWVRARPGLSRKFRKGVLEYVDASMLSWDVEWLRRLDGGGRGPDIGRTGRVGCFLMCCCGGAMVGMGVEDIGIKKKYEKGWSLPSSFSMARTPAHLSFPFEKRAPFQYYTSNTRSVHSVFGVQLLFAPCTANSAAAVPLCPYRYRYPIQIVQTRVLHLTQKT